MASGSRGFSSAVAALAVGPLLVIAASVNQPVAGAAPRLSALPVIAPAPRDNPTTPERVALGRLLFWDPILSGQKDVACATCHHPDFGYSDGLDVSIGANGRGLGASRTFAAGHPSRFVKRNSQTVLNVAFNGLTADDTASPQTAPMFWDLRVQSLEAQALEPIKAVEEMRGDVSIAERAVPDAVARLNGIPEYRRLFAAAFGGEMPVSEGNLAKALAAFERTLVTTDAPFDRYMRGETDAMSPEQVRGMEQFQSIGCINCHNGPMFSDYKPHVLGVPDNRKLLESDTGVNQTYAFRTASLRNLTETPPYMHSGVFQTLPQVLNFYQRISGGRGGPGGGGRGGRAGNGGPPPPPQGGRGGGGGRGGSGFRGGPPFNPQVTRAQIDPLARQLNMRGGRGQRDVIAFLRALTDPHFDRTIPDRVPSGLPVGGRLR
ncbi:MAG TPA: cytochrome c peroxidase [Vicinamibacterales bacterium]|jgi:cytochrome c peroxidase|nr:cytochrome c peroxidase [Vicinamibacterales bacterium]